MPDYKEMYLKMVRATEEAIEILIKAQRECEEMYIADPPEPPLGNSYQITEERLRTLN